MEEGIFLNIRNDIMLWVVVYALCHKKTFYPPYEGSEKLLKKTLYNQKNSNHHMWVFDSWNEASGCTGYNAKKTQLPKVYCTVHHKRSFLNICNFWGFKFIFSAMLHCKELSFLHCNQCIQTLHLVIFIVRVTMGFLIFQTPRTGGTTYNYIFFQNSFCFLMA